MPPLPPRRPALVALAPVLAIVLSGATTVFRDIPAGHWARRPAGVLHDRKIMTGRTPVDFAGDVTLTRYELAKILSALYNVEGPPGTFLVLKDQQPGHTATLEVQRVLGYGLMKTKGAGVFDGEAQVSKKELVEALDLLFAKNGVSAPAQRTNRVFFSDVGAGSALGVVLDRIVNRYALIDAKPGSAFSPHNTVSRFSVLAMLVRAMPYVNPPVALELKEPRPTPAPSGVSPDPTTEPTPEASLEPGQSPEPTPTPPPPAALLRSRAQVGADVILLFNEGLPNAVGAISAAESRGFSGNMLPGGAFSGQGWSGPLGGGLEVTASYVGINVPNAGKQVPVDLVESLVVANGYYKVASGPGWELAAGAGGLFRNTYNTAGALLNQYYISADKLYFGGGPAVAWATALGPAMVLTADMQVQPVIMESYTLAAKPKSLMRWGTTGAMRLEYGFGGGWYLGTGARLLLSGAYDGGIQTMIGAQAGVGTHF